MLGAVAERLRQHERDLMQKMPGEAQGGEALRNAATVAERVARLIAASGTPAVPSQHDP